FSLSIWLYIFILFLSAILLSVMAYGITISRRYPFSDDFETVKEGGYTAKSILLMLLTTPFLLVHYLSALLPYGKITWLILLSGMTLLVWKLVCRRKKETKKDMKTNVESL